ncbi:hypothetical protein DR950_21845 [Kitasatospora xanthocidica]|uniref:Uncharacterized protein n=1 Tax=Kitasatospora xanthocidica TaxID=83382 RepID=A0A372ZW02_9ACTN|nr:hypothetical protein [Kitasatospora xanthocidica]RGD60076.1 hypothetical protein DR950_21845 [Kitasatospora xanthocidica]
MSRPHGAPGRPPVHWAPDLVLAAVVVAGAVAAASVGSFVLNWLKLLALYGPGVEALDVFGVVVMLVLLALTGRGTRRLGYRITPYAALAAAPLMPLVFWLTSDVPVIGR